MSNWSAPQTLAIPAGKLVVFCATHQAQFTQQVQIIDAQGMPITFHTFDGQSHTFPITGEGTSVNLFANGNGKFTMQAGYQIQFKNSGSQTSLVAASTVEFDLNGIVYGGGTLFATDDQGGSEPDYNDTSLSLQWFNTQG
ncbi:hypothetical protein PSECIP111951_03782 [Pseudoalteromonas holothuriae]|uniref:Uncharacterized protein n=1 Tax=Pseudoalteromonas holothuriae TaxID=2963714 RepID=A0A9W4QQV8_9GAMM|nr:MULTISPECIES: hypothetical protein [unclassified Pseudoalteromonas]CAH9049552.1 hypothetical protein PSECIP111854_00194 [Pseudoalteromonas sp. CIP111854]CAH9067390.1 hypothetical protein PSECIP111951_03782 [Pseudoalteromonas sp. CIP111951]